MSISVSLATDFNALTCPVDETLVCELSPDGQPVEALVQLRLQGFHGPVILYGLTPVVLQRPGLEWLAPALRQELGFYTPEEAPTARCLSQQAWRHSATLLYCFATRTLNHDFKHLLREWPERRYDLQHLWERLQDKLGQLLPFLQSQVNQLNHLMYQAETSVPDLESAWLDFWNTLHQGQRQPVDTEALARDIHSLSLHWPALVAERTAFDLPEQQTENPSAVADLSHWLRVFNARHLQQPQRVIDAAHQLKALRVKLSEDLRQHLHNTLEQHLYLVAQHLQRWQWVSDFYYPDVQLTFNQLELWKSRLPLSPPAFTAAESTLNTAFDTAPDKPYLLVLEDNPVWTEDMRQQVHQDALLRQYLKHYQWVSVNNLRDAKPYLKKAAILITDLSMPLEPQEPPAREHGIAFLENLVGQYARHAPVIIVHTTPTHFLQDHLALSQAGVLDADYVLKNEPNVLVERLRKACERLAQPETFHLVLHPKHFVLNGVTLQLSALNQQLLRCLATGQRTARQLLEQLVAAGHSEYMSDLEAQPDTGVLITWSDLLQQLPAPLRAGLCSLKDDGLSQTLWRDLQQWAGLSRSENHAIAQAADVRPLIALGQQRLKQNLWLEPALLPILPQVLYQLMRSTRDSEHPDYRLNTKVSKMVSSLRKEVYEQCVAVQRIMNIGQWITRDTHDRYGLLATTLEEAQSALPPVDDIPRRWPVLLIEDDATYAQEIQELLHTIAHQHHLQLECTWVAHGGQWPEVLEQLRSTASDKALNNTSLPYLVLLDLHLPAQAGAAPDAHTGYHLWKTLREQLQPAQYQVLVTSTLTHEDNLRLEGIRLGIPLQQFIPKGESLHQVLWPESLQLAVLRLLQEQRQGGKVARERVNVAPVVFPLQVELVDYDKKVLYLRISLLSAPHAVYEAKHRNLNARWLLRLLKAPNTLISAEALMHPDGYQRTQVNNLRNRLRHQIENQWPLDQLPTPGERVAKLLLAQQTVHHVPHFALRVARVIDPRGLCLTV